MSRLREVVTAQAAFLFGRFRPFGALEESEQKAVMGEKVAWASTLCDYLRALPNEEAAILRNLREVTREFQMEERRTVVPTPEQVAARVKARFSVRVVNPCRGCEEMGGLYEFAGPEAPLLRKESGSFPWPEGAWLCHEHHAAACYHGFRERMLRDGRTEAQALRQVRPPRCLLPTRYYDTPFAARPSPLPWTDGDLEGPMSAWARGFVEKTHGWTSRRLGEEEQPEPSLIPEQPEPEAYEEV